MDETPECNLVKFIRLGKGKGLADKASQSLAQGVVPAFHMSRLPGFFAHRLMSSTQMTKDLIVGLPKIAEGGAMTVGAGQPRPEAPAIFFGAAPDPIGDNLTRTAAQGYPDPPFVFFEPTNDQSSSNSKMSSGWAGARGGMVDNGSSSSRNHLATVCRATPNVRSRPRKLDRSW